MTRLAMWPKSLLSLTYRRNERRAANLLKTPFPATTRNHLSEIPTSQPRGLRHESDLSIKLMKASVPILKRDVRGDRLVWYSIDLSSRGCDFVSTEGRQQVWILIPGM
jgi:hypothetical protein